MSLVTHTAYPSESDQAVLIVTKTGKQMAIYCTAKQYTDGLAAYKKGALLQSAFSFLEDDEREFLQSGLLPDEFKKLFGEPE